MGVRRTLAALELRPKMPRQRKLVLSVGISAGVLCGLVVFSMRGLFVEAWWIERLGSVNYLERKGAAEELGVLRSARAVPRLLDLLVAEASLPPPGPDCECTGARDPFHGTPAHVYRDALLAVGQPAVVELRRALEKGTDASRVWAAHLLGTIVVDLVSAREDEEEAASEGPVPPRHHDLAPLVSDAVDSLAAQLGSPHEALRTEAIEWLGKLDAASLAALFRVMESGEEIACESAASAFWQVPTSAAWDVARLKALLASGRPETRRAGVRCLAYVAYDASAALSRYRRDLEREQESGSVEESEEDRAWHRRVGGIRDEVEKLLVDRLDDLDPAMRRTAIDGLASTSQLSTVAIQALTRLLLDPDEEVGEMASAGLAENGARVPLPVLVRVLERGTWRARVDAAGAIEDLGAGGVGAAPALIAVLEENDPLRSQAIEALAAMGLRALPELVAALSCEEPGIRSGATRAIARLSGSAAERTTWLGAKADAVLPALIEGLSFDDFYLWKASLDALAAVGRSSPRGSEILLALLESPDEARRLAAASILACPRDPMPEVMTVLLLGARHGSRFVREHAVEALAAMRDADPEAVLAALLDALEDPESAAVGMTAAYALASWTSRAADAGPGLLRAFRGSRLPGMPGTAFRALLRIHRGNPGAIAPLFVEALGHQDANVRIGLHFLLWEELRGAEAILIDGLPQVPDGALDDLLWTLTRLNHDLEPALPVLFDRLRRTSLDDTRRALVVAIAHAARGSARVKSSVLDALREEKIQPSMVEVLELLGPAAADAVPALRRLGRSSDVSLQHAIARALEEIEARGK